MTKKKVSIFGGEVKKVILNISTESNANDINLCLLHYTDVYSVMLCVSDEVTHYILQFLSYMWAYVEYTYSICPPKSMSEPDLAL